MKGQELLRRELQELSEKFKVCDKEREQAEKFAKAFQESASMCRGDYIDMERERDDLLQEVTETAAQLDYLRVMYDALLDRMLGEQHAN